MLCWIEGGAGFFLFSVLLGGAVELPGRSRPAPGVVAIRRGGAARPARAGAAAADRRRQFHFSDIPVRGDDGARAVGASDDDASPVRRGASYGVSFATTRSATARWGSFPYSPAVFRRRIIAEHAEDAGTKAPRPTCGLCRKTYRGGGMPLSEVAACYRLYAACCVELARDPLEPGRKVALLDMAQAWARLAERVEKNSGILPGDVRKASPLGERSSRHEQPVET